MYDNNYYSCVAALRCDNNDKKKPAFLTRRANIWSIMSITSRMTLDASRPFTYACVHTSSHTKRARETHHTFSWLNMGIVTGQLTSLDDAKHPESSMNYEINPTTQGATWKKFIIVDGSSAIHRYQTSKLFTILIPIEIFLSLLHVECKTSSALIDQYHVFESI